MLALPFYVVFAGLTLWGFFRPDLAVYFFFGIALLGTAWLLVMNRSLASSRLRNLDVDAMEVAEREVLFKYPMYFYYPFQARQYSSLCSLLQALSVVWLGILAWNKLWVLCVAPLILMVLVTHAAPRLNPRGLFQYHAARGALPLQLEDEFEVLKIVEDKVLAARGWVRNADGQLERIVETRGQSLL